MQEKSKKNIFIIFFAILLLPLLQQQFSMITSGGLDGFFTNAPDVQFSWGKWWDGSYQQGKADFINDHIGFRPDLIRCHNQLQFWLYSKTHARSVVVGKNGYLYQDVYISSYYGRDYNYDSLRTQLIHLKAVQDTLEALGKTIVFIHAPCKAYYYPEYIPDRLKKATRGTTNYEAFLRMSDSLGIHQVDMNKWYISLKGHSSELLYPKQAFHWSVYGSLLAEDTLIRYLEDRMHIKMPHPTWDKITHTQHPRCTDDDIAKTCDLIFPTAKETFSYPDVYYTKPDTNIKKPKVIYIGDSFILTWIYDGLMANTNTDWQVWYYFKYVYDKEHTEDQPPLYLNNTDWITTLKGADCIVIMQTAHNLIETGNGFVEKAYAYFYPAKSKK